jgi:glutaredoxin 3
MTNSEKKEVVIYSTPTCHYCQLAKEFFKENNVAYTEHNVLTDLEKRQEMLDKSDQMGVPVISINGKIIIGFDQTEISSLLEI